MAQLDKTFPTNDCAMCIMAPKLVEVGKHPNIELITYSELIEITGDAGNFKVKILKKARYVDENCTGCGSCAEVCPVEFPNEFDIGLGKRHAIYVPFPQAVPLQYTINKHGMQPCVAECPASVGAPGYITLVSHGKFYEALQIIKEKLPFPSICGRVCHRPCEKKCERNKLDGPVGIAHIKRFVGDLELNIPAIEAPSVLTRAESVAIVGGGPAGLTAAHDLVLMGYHVRIYESTPVLGGMMRFGIPRFRLPKEILEREITGILRLGVSVQLNTTIGRTLEIKDLFDFGHKAVFFAIGAQKGKPMKCPGEKLEGVYQAIEFLKEVNLGKIIKTSIAKIDMDACTGCGLCAPACIYNAIELTPDKENSKRQYPLVSKYMCTNCGKCASACPSKAIRLSGFRDTYSRIGGSVIVVGGGNAALDTARTAIRLGAKNVTIMYRRSREEMPAEPDWEIDETELEGVKLLYCTAIKRAIGENGRLKTIVCIKMKLGELDKSGRRSPVPIPGSEHTIEVDNIILAIGQVVNMGTTTDEVNLERTPWGTLKIDPITMETNMKGVFSGGDAAVGSGTVIGAVAAGKEAAISIDRYINGIDLRAGRDIKPEIAEVQVEGLKKKRKVKMKYLPIEEREDNFNEVELGYTEKEAMKEADRCLTCGGCADCYECSRNCEANAIHHNMEPEEIEIDVGSVILSPGFKEFDAARKKEYGYERFSNVVSSIEFERILSASGPFAGNVQRLSDGREPKTIAFLQCIGSRDEKTNHYCSSVCCMYSIKEAIIAQEHSPGLQPHIFFMDIRAFGKEFEDYYIRAQDEYGINFTRCRVPGIEEDPITNDLIINYVEDGTRMTKRFDMVVLAVGLEAPEKAKELSEKAGVDLNEYGFCDTSQFTPFETSRPGIYVGGAFSEPKDIPMTVADASGVAAKASAIISSERHSLVTEKTYPPERDVRGEATRIGVFVCKCGINISSVVNVPEVVEYAKNLQGVVYVDWNTYSCSQDTQKTMIEMAKEHHLNRVIVASCTPRTHEPLFQSTIQEAGLNPHLFEMANIRDQCSWVHKNDHEGATEKAKTLVRMAVAKAHLIEPLTKKELPVIPKGLVIGGGVAGMSAALEMGDQGFDTYLVEHDRKLGGRLRDRFFLPPNQDAPILLRSLTEKIEEHPRIKVFTDTRIIDVSGHVGHFKTTISRGDGKEESELEHGIIVIATGANRYKPTEYHYGQHDRVITQIDLEASIASGTISADRVVMIQCVGSRDEVRSYCSRTCCGEAIKNALEIKSINPETEVIILYKDIRTYGFREKYYKEAAKMGVIFIRYDDDHKPVSEITGQGDLELTMWEPLLKRYLSVKPDLLVLSNGMVPQEGTKELSQLLKLPTTKHGFFMEAHMKLRPVDFANSGMFLCGDAHSPKYVEESMAQASATAGRAATILSRPFLEVGGSIARVNEEDCAGCLTCVRVCPYSVPRIGEEGVAIIDESECQGCGVCASECPAKAIQVLHFKDNQVLAQCDGMLLEVV
ncbi:MAG: FAD-dependent oxidoreductase [Candidatus Thermoplasmatota archaeon]|nr:FAD-dependent oxidoreductase [Candidatus Thermoplasmatota archaeon]